MNPKRMRRYVIGRRPRGVVILPPGRVLTAVDFDAFLKRMGPGYIVHV